jgi:hypothetical protein
VRAVYLLGRSGDAEAIRVISAGRRSALPTMPVAVPVVK